MVWNLNCDLFSRTRKGWEISDIAPYHTIISNRISIKIRISTACIIMTNYCNFYLIESDLGACLKLLDLPLDLFYLADTLGRTLAPRNEPSHFKSTWLFDRLMGTYIVYISMVFFLSILFSSVVQNVIYSFTLYSFQILVARHSQWWDLVVDSGTTGLSRLTNGVILRSGEDTYSTLASGEDIRAWCWSIITGLSGLRTNNIITIHSLKPH